MKRSKVDFAIDLLALILGRSLRDWKHGWGVDFATAIVLATLCGMCHCHWESEEDAGFDRS